MSATATIGTWKQIPGRGAETDEGDGTCCESQLVSRDHDELTKRLRLLESERVEINDQLNDSETVLPFGNPCPIETTDDRLASKTLTNHAVCRSIWATIPSHSNTAHFPLAG